MSEKKVDFKLTREGFVKIEHKEAGSAEVVPESLPAWLDSGWSVADPDKTDDPGRTVVVDEQNRTGTVVTADKAPAVAVQVAKNQEK